MPIISFLFRTRNNINTKLVNYGLSLSAGSMITTALYKMLPGANSDDQNGWTIFFGVLVGMCLSLLLNYLVHACASESLMHCAHEQVSQAPEGAHDEHAHHHEHENECDDEPYDGQAHMEHTSIGNSDEHVLSSEENAPLKSQKKTPTQQLKTKSSLLDMLSTVDSSQMGDCHNLGGCVPMTKAESFSCVPATVRLCPNGSSSSDSLPEHTSNINNDQHADPTGLACLENRIGYDLENLPLYRKNFHSLRRQSHQHHENGSMFSDGTQDYGSLSTANNNETSVSGHHHHHHLETPFSKLLSIGMQTCVVITLHKFPEGFIIYYTNKSSDVSKALGFSIFLSLTIHNFVEGFSMTLPFYAAFEKKVYAILITTILGGCSQPLGALIGYLIFKDKKGDPDKEPRMDLYLSITAGFLLVIGLQMFQTGVGFSQGHHHHQGEADEEVKENHSLGTMCLRWCCVGVLLILASGLFT